MSAPEGTSKDTPTPPTNSTVVLLLNTIADTTWRMFAPTLGLAALGLWADLSWNTGPVWSLIGVFAGIIIAALLIRQQFKKIKE